MYQVNCLPSLAFRIAVVGFPMLAKGRRRISPCLSFSYNSLRYAKRKKPVSYDFAISLNNAINCYRYASFKPDVHDDATLLLGTLIDALSSEANCILPFLVSAFPAAFPAYPYAPLDMLDAVAVKLANLVAVLALTREAVSDTLRAGDARALPVI